MKKSVFLSLFTLCFPILLFAQSVDDDLYFVPTKQKVKSKHEVADDRGSDNQEKMIVVDGNPTSTAYDKLGNTTIVVKDQEGNLRDVDEYNRRYSSKRYNFTQSNDTLYVEEKNTEGLNGEWMNEFDGSKEDFEYATRILRFRSPRLAVSISSPYYWDIVYGVDAFNWNVYTDGHYAYAFPTISNPLYWNWRYDYWGWRWGNPYNYWSPYRGYYWRFGWNGCYDYPYWGNHHHPTHHHHIGWYPGMGNGKPSHHWNGKYTDRQSFGNVRSNGLNRGSARTSISTRQGTSHGRQNVQRSESDANQVNRQPTSSGIRRVVGTRDPSSKRVGAERTDAASSRRTVYTRPSSTRTTSQANSSDNKTVKATPSNSRRVKTTYTQSGGKRNVNSRTTSNGNSRNYSYSRDKGTRSSGSSSGGYGGSGSYSSSHIGSSNNSRSGGSVRSGGR